ncbi:TonB-dependent receptor [Sulfidibacter corallicola]|uniref:TonB-dependent receptor n=1 Tax=Sulfidibacter corallicola TaxID=2818388 RepID=A0A8A4TK08_SULCO|nr:TonB-dependent receptor [Sulfidibacter corallicola]QTD49817.1 TonB-dependent receptor [Sulfidibacter corallicola]
MLTNAICLLSLYLMWQIDPLKQDPHGEPPIQNELSLEDLLELRVSVASIEAEGILETPAVVSRYEAEDMRRIGLTTLREMLSLIPGLVPIDTEIGTTSLMLRGLAEFFNQKILFLLNGVPYWQPSHGDNPLWGIPLEAVSHVEVIRGPGAVLYGTNATAGVVNIVLEEIDGGRASATLGSHAQRELGFAYGGVPRSLSQTRYTVAGSWRDEKGYAGLFENRPPPPFFPPGSPSRGTLERFHHAKSLLARMQIGRTDFLAHAFTSSSSGLAGPATPINRAELQYEGYLLHVAHRWSRTTYDLTLFGDYNNFFLKIPTDNLIDGRYHAIQEFSNDGRDNARGRLGAQVNLNLNDSLDWFSGIDYEHRESGEYGNTPADPARDRLVTMTPQHHDELALYSQLDWNTERWRLVVGARATHHERIGWRTQPRMALIYRPTTVHSFKLLYGEGFNTPNFVQTSLVIPNVVLGNPDLVPETVATFDLAYTYATSHALFVANIYRFEGSDFIVRTPLPDRRESMYLNARSFHRTGGELDFQFSYRKFKTMASAAYNDAGNRELADDPTALFSPRWNGSLGVRYRLGERHHLGLSARYVGPQDTASDYTLVHAAYSFSYRGFHTSLVGGNLLDQTPLHADIANQARDRLSPNGDPSPFGRISFRIVLDAFGR